MNAENTRRLQDGAERAIVPAPAPVEPARAERGEVTAAGVAGAVALGALAAAGVAAMGFAIGWGIAELIW